MNLIYYIEITEGLLVDVILCSLTLKYLTGNKMFDIYCIVHLPDKSFQCCLPLFENGLFIVDKKHVFECC